MAPNKFEEHLKEKLEKREIQPSAGSWDTLDSRLNNSKKGSEKKYWISAVAAVTVLLIASILFLDQQDQNSTPIVETPVEKTVKDNSENNEFENVVQVTSEETKEKVQQKIELSKKNRSELGSVTPEIISPEKAEKLASNTPEERLSIEPVFIAPPSETEDLNADFSGKITDLLAKISKYEKESGNITDAEVDALLAEAAKEISEERDVYAKGKIRAANLLAEVEFEVDQSFRKEVFDFLKEEFLKAKTAVVTRND